MTLLSFAFSPFLLSLYPDVRYTRDVRSWDDESYTEYCVGLYQRAETWVCVEVAR